MLHGKKSFVPPLKKILDAARLLRLHLALMGPRLLCSPLRWWEEVGTSIWCYSWVAKIKVWPTDNEAMVAMVMLHRRRTRFSRPLVHLISGDFTRDIEEAGNLLIVAPMEWWILYRLRVLRRFCVYTNIFNSSTATTSAVGRWSLGARAQDFPTVINNVRPLW
jgi:hypothetical protein